MKMRKVYKEKWEEVKNIIDRDVDENLYFGKYNTNHIRNSLKHFMISMSRYKFVVKMLKYKKQLNVLEIGCGEGLGGLMFAQETSLKEYVGVDMDEQSIEWAKKNIMREDLPLEYMVGDLFDEKLLVDKKYDAVFCLDVIEHAETSSENIFMKMLCEKLNTSGCCIIGTPNETMNEYASEASKIAHINLYNHDRLYSLMDQYFENVFMFSMNDEVVSTGFEPMACYIFAIGAGKKN